MSSQHSKIQKITKIALMVALIAVVSQIVIPMPSYVPLTLQVFIIALVSYILGVRDALITVLTYIALGAIGVPVFASFRGGIYALFDYTGGFIWSFIIIAILCGISSKKSLAIVLGIISALISHLMGTLWYMVIARVGLGAALVAVSLPYILKDVLLIPLAYALASKIKKHKI